MQIALLIFASIAVCVTILYIATKDISRLLWLIKYGIKTRGHIVRDHTIMIKGGLIHFPVVHFKDDAGFIHEFQSRYQKESSFRDQLSEVTVIYDPKSPGKNAEIFERRHFYPSIVQVMIFIVIAAGIPAALLLLKE